MLDSHSRIFPLLLFQTVVFAHRPEIGFRAGFPVTNSILYTPIACSALNSPPCSYEAAGRYFLFGLSVFLPITNRLGLRTDPAYQRLSFSNDNPTPGNSDYQETTTANRWILPLLGTWNISKHLRPGVGAAVSFRTDARLTSKLSVFAPGAYTNLSERDPGGRSTIVGVVAAIEAPYRVRSVTLAPEIRYTRWTGKHFGRHWPLDEVSAGVAIRF